MHCKNLNLHCFALSQKSQDVVLFVLYFLCDCYIHKSLFNLYVVSRPYGIDLHCHRRETLTAFFSLDHMVCVGVRLCIADGGSV